MDKTCFLSIIVPVYNVERYLPHCLDSLLAQDVENYEILCVDDGSTDGSGAILDRYQARCSRIHVIHQPNAGVAQARNTGLKEAVGTYIWFVDSDDWIQENCLGRLRNVLEETGCDRLCIGGIAVQEDPDGNKREEGVPWQDAVVWRNLLRRQFLQEHGLNFRYPEITHGEDGLLMFEIIRSKPETVVLTDTLYFYRIRPGSAETGKSLTTCRNRIRSHLRVVEVLHGYYQAPDGKTEETANFLMSRLWMVLYDAASMPKAESREAVKRLGELGLFPGKRLLECTLRETYMAGMPGIAGTVVDWFCLHLHTRWGFLVIQTLHRVRNGLRSLRKR